MDSDSFCQFLYNVECLVEEASGRGSEGEGLARGCVSQVESWKVSDTLWSKERCQVGFQSGLEEGNLLIEAEGEWLGSGEKGELWSI